MTSLLGFSGYSYPHPSVVRSRVHTTQEEPVLNCETAWLLRKVTAAKVQPGF